MIQRGFILTISAVAFVFLFIQIATRTIETASYASSNDSIHSVTPRSVYRVARAQSSPTATKPVLIAETSNRISPLATWTGTPISPPRPTASVTPANRPSPTPPLFPQQGDTEAVQIEPGSSTLDDYRAPIRITFKEPMDRSSVRDALTFNPAINFATNWLDDQTLEIVPTEFFQPGTYTLWLQNSIKTVNGQSLNPASPYYREYRFQPILVNYTVPQSWDPDDPLTLTFGEAMDSESVEAALQIDPSWEGEWRWNQAQTVATFHSDTPPPLNTWHTLRFDASHLPLRTRTDRPVPSPNAISFQTTGPIVSAQPMGSHIDPASEMRIRFAQPMDHASVEASLHMTPTRSVTFEWQGNTLLVQPEEAYWDERTLHTVTIEPSALDAEKSTLLAGPYIWSFRTGAFRTVANFGLGPNIQVVDAAGRRALQFQTLHDGTVNLTFKLYALSLDQFLVAFQEHLRPLYEDNHEPIETEALPLVTQWQHRSIRYSNGRQNPNQPDSIGETLLPADIEPGLYILNLTAGQVNDQLLVLLTHNVVMVKQAENQLVTWVTDINDQPLENSDVYVYGQDGEFLQQGRSSADGLFRAELLPENEPQLVLAGNPSTEDYTVSGLTREWRSSNNRGGWWWYWESKVPHYAVHIYTDRPIYRPGQTVFYKSVVRRDNDAILSLLPPDTPVMVRIRDARDNVVQTTTHQTNEFGTLHGEFQIAEGAMLGDYAVEIVLSGPDANLAQDAEVAADREASNASEQFRQTFKVEEYRKPDFAVTVQTAKSRYVIGEEVEIQIETKYLLGEPVADAQLTIRHYSLTLYYGFGWQPSDKTEYIWTRNNTSETVATTDQDGRFTTSIRAPHLNNHAHYHWGSSLRQTTWGIEVTVDDGSGQSVSNVAIVEVYNAAEKLTLEVASYVQKAGGPFDIDIAATTLDGEPLPEHRLLLELRRWDQTGRGYSLVTDSFSFVTDEAGLIRAPLTIDVPGSYQLFLRDATPKKADSVNFQSYIYIAGEAQNWYSSLDQTPLNIETDRDTYVPGERAQLAIESAFNGPALLTFERGTTRREKLIDLTAPLTLVEVEIEPEDAPNIFVTVNAWQKQDTTERDGWAINQPDALLFMDSVELTVPARNKRLNVTIMSDHDQYAPRDEATFKLLVTDFEGNPVQAELSLALVDEAIFTLSDDLSGDIFEAFYFKRQNAVRTYDSMVPIRWPGGGGGGGGGGNGATPPRRDFPDTAQWIPSILTNAAGEASVTIALPDSLTSWRMTAKATTANETEVGETFINITTHQPLVVRPILPASLTAGDRVHLSAVVHNYSEQSVAVDVLVRVDAADSREGSPPSLQISATEGDPITQTVTVEPGASHIVGWQAVATQAGSVEMTVTAQLAERATDQDVAHNGSTDESSAQSPSSSTTLYDAVQLPLTIRPLAVPDVTTFIGDFSDEFTLDLELPADALDMSSVEIEVSRSIAGSLLNGLEFLTGFPYGCVEQTMSRALPNAVVGRAFEQLGMSNPNLKNDLPMLINAGIQRLYGFQHDDGGWGWWHDDKTDAYQSAWVLFGLSVTAEAGYEVDPDVVRRGVRWLALSLDGMDPRTRAFALYAMTRASALIDLSEQFRESGRYTNDGQKILMGPTLHEQIEQHARGLILNAAPLEPFSQSALALVLNTLGDDKAARRILSQLAQTAIQDGTGLHWKSNRNDGAYYQKTMASATRSTALALSAFTQIWPDHSGIPDMMRWLMGQRRMSGWGTTNETSFAILGLTDFLLASQEHNRDVDYVIELNGHKVSQGQLGSNEPIAQLTLSRGQLHRGINEVHIRQLNQIAQSDEDQQREGDSEESSRLYYLINQRTYLAKPNIVAAGTIQLTRTYQDPKTHEPLTQVKMGQLVEVKLQVDTSALSYYLIVEDQLPGGLEALNERLNTTPRVVYGRQQQESHWQFYGYNYKEIHNDRVSFFVTEMGAGQRTFTYLARATRPGAFVAMPAEAYPMYDPTVWGRSSSHSLTVAADES
ncbi:Ig-like domain-containing protein [Chloroflexi bacterium TSY]|nr:Ig-like domain-containing protein [Chloroflexi bacterium TSY]